MPLLFIIFLFTSTFFFGQENGAISDLLKEAETKLYKQPQQSGKIAIYIISQNESPLINVEAALLLAKSFLVRGEYENASKSCIQALKFSNLSKDAILKSKTKVFAITLFRKLGLKTVAEIYKNDLVTSKENSSTVNWDVWLKGKLLQDSAYVQFSNANYRDSENLLQEAKKKFFEIEDTISVDETSIALATLWIETGQLENAKAYLQPKKESLEIGYERLLVLQGLGNVYFKEMDYQKAVAIFEEAAGLAVDLPNSEYENFSLQGLSQGYLALENTSKFFLYKQQTNRVSQKTEVDRNLAINLIYNYINTSVEEVAEAQIASSYTWLYSILALFLFLIILGLIASYVYRLKSKEYHRFHSFLLSQNTVKVKETKTVVLNKSSIISSDTENILLQKLDVFESGKTFTNAHMSIGLLASQLDTNTKYLSDIINRHKDQNFNSYINELRINYIIDKLKTETVYFNYKVSYLAKESGFSSHSNFARVFKTVTGISPTKFMEFLQHRKETA